ncbi:hypothetical protein GGI02_001390 [Coemansia sp. RSA 2322]|nr:hypothetical protein GGI02_001390 [Coemansia sp. RSA 2322]
MSHHRLGQHTELSLSLPPIRASSSNAHPHAAIPRGSLSQSYSSSAPLVHPGALANATHAAPKPSPSPHQLLLPAISGLVRAPPTTPDGGGSAFIAAATAPASPTPNAMESPTGSSTGGLASGARGNATPGGSRSYSGSQSGGIGAVVSQQKVEKNRFQANIRAFVDHLFIAQPAARWDYKQSFKAPRNAHVTHHVIQSFHAAYGGSYERIEHGLGVYFSSLKAKHRTTDDKAMMKQQRDRRRARRIKKAAGRRKVFDYAQYPFLPADFDAQLCFVPSAMSPEHTDDDGEVKVGGLPWRSQTFTKLFRHLDTLRPKRTVRPTNPNLNSDALPLPDVPSFMLDQAYLAIERTYQPHDSEDDIEMGTSSDEAGSPSGSTVYM